MAGDALTIAQPEAERCSVLTTFNLTTSVLAPGPVPELYMQWYRLYGIPVPGRGRPWHFKYLTVQHIYVPLAQSSGKIYALLKAHKAQGGDRAKKLFQFLNEIGTRVLEMAESSQDRYTYERKIVERFGGQQELPLIVAPQSEPKHDTTALPLFDSKTKEAAN